ncbi:hypothetical protein [Amycolatopsis pigmentata]|uniref:Uncharacterized protein n=1 Tax=Amycolatopsis pigmentata TaxID=450801 RepID=A0ABW5G3Q2_9PSEU
MADSTAGLAGQDATPPPSWDVNQYKTWDDLDKVVSDLTHNGDAWADLTHNAAAERWYVLEDKLGKAIKALGTANASFQKEVSGLKGQFAGVADQAFQDLASKVYRQSEDVYNTMSSRSYATTVGNIGHDIQSFAQAWWDLVRDAHKTEDTIRSTYKSIIDSATDTATITKAENDLKDAYNKAEEALCTKLRELLGRWRDRYELRGGDLSPLHVEVPFGGPGTQGGGSGGQNGQPDYMPYSYGTPANYETPQQPLLPRQQFAQATPEMPNLPANAPGTGASGAGADSGAGGSGPGAGSSGSGAGGSDPGAAAARQKALQDAKNAADGAIGALQNPSGGAGSGAGDGSGAGSPGTGGGSGSQDGSGGGSSPGTSGSGSQGAGTGGGSGGGDQGAAARQKALQDAKKAADGAIGALQSPGGLGDPGSGTGGGSSGGGSGSGDPGSGTGGGSGGGSDSGAVDPARQQGLQAAKDAANKAIDALKKPGDSPDRTKALQDAKDAADKAIDGLAGPSGSDSGQGGGSGKGGGGSDGSGSGSGSGSPDNQKALQDAKDAADKAIDGLNHPGGTGADGKPSTVSDPNHPGAQSPDTQKALQDAKDAADKAIDGLKNGTGDPSSLSDFLKGTGQPGDPAMGKAEHDAQSAIDKAIESLPGYNGNDAYAQALHQAKDAADHAIQALPDYASVGGAPGEIGAHTPVLNSADPLGGHDGSGFGVGTGGGAGGGGAPGPDARLDTDVAQNEGLHQVGPDGVQQRAVAGVPAGAVQSSPGMPPMMPPGMGGMGGMGAMGGNKREREPNTWLQAEHGTWRDDHDDDEPPSVLGRA